MNYSLQHYLNSSHCERDGEKSRCAVEDALNQYEWQKEITAIYGCDSPAIVIYEKRHTGPQ